MTLVINQTKKTGSTSSGSLAVNTGIPVMGICRQIIVKPTTATTQYDFKITSPQSVVVYERIGEVGTLAEINDLPLLGTYTLTISNATNDEAFEIYLMTEE